MPSNFLNTCLERSSISLSFMYGIIRLIFSIIFILLNKFCANADFYKHSRVRPYFTAIINQIRTSLPPDIVKRFNI